MLRPPRGAHDRGTCVSGAGGGCTASGSRLTGQDPAASGLVPGRGPVRPAALCFPVSARLSSTRGEAMEQVLPDARAENML